MKSKKIIIEFKPIALEHFEKLTLDKRFGGLALKFYRELFDFPPEEWGRLRKEYGKETFVSDKHIPFVIQVIVVEETDDHLKLYVTEFDRRKA
jgi:hypothetical protein